MNYKILVLNKFYFPISVEGVQKTFGNIFSGSVIPLDITYEQEDNGKINLESVEYFTAVSCVKDWIDLPIRPYDDYLQTVRGPVRVPQVVICSNFDNCTNFDPRLAYLHYPSFFLCLFLLYIVMLLL